MLEKINTSKGFDLGCFHFEVLIDKSIAVDLRDRQRFGECSSSQQTIKISSDFKPDQYHNTFLHESIEAINAIYCNGELKQNDITNLANGLAQVIKSLGVIFTDK